jgi:cellulose synthase/poly-beta-1,6-N-acetylglucosamine synthase-like glycosyltransferase
VNTPEAVQLLSGLLRALFWLAGVPVLAGCAYLLLLTLLSGRITAPPLRDTRLRFDVFVPAHDEAAGIARTVRNLRRLDWPPGAFRVRVIADNCGDDTAARARAAGAEVLERHEPQRRGKGHALDWAFGRSVAEGWADAVVVVDADSEASPNLLRACAARLQAGACAVQVRYGVLNPQASWRTRLMAVALGAIHDLRSRARERLRLSSGIRGNGWCVATAILRGMPYQCHSLVEDVEYGIALGLAGERVRYADEAQVLGEMTSRGDTAASQRRRWEQGRRQLGALRRPLLRQAWRKLDPVCLDLCADLALPPLSQLALGLAALALAALLLGAAGLALPGAVPLLAAAAAALALYVLRGWRLSGLGPAVLLDLIRVPWFVAWKLWVLAQRSNGEWLRTGRERP